MTTTTTQSPLVLDPAAQELLFREARTANAFTGEPVGEEQVRAIYDLVRWAPTAFRPRNPRLDAAQVITTV